MAQNKVSSGTHSQLNFLFYNTPAGLLHGAISRRTFEKYITAADEKMKQTSDGFWNKQRYRASQGTLHGWQASTYLTTTGIVLFGTGRAHQSIRSFGDLSLHQIAYPNARGCMLDGIATFSQEMGVFLVCS